MNTSNPLKSLLAALCLSLAAAHAGAASLSLTPASTTVSVGTNFSLDLVGTDLSDLYAFQFALNFDPSIIHVLGVTEGAALSTAGTTFFAPGTADNTTGALTLTGDTLIGPIAGFTGSGTLASISFSAVAGGKTTIFFSDVFTLTSTLELGDATLGSASVAVIGAAPVPEPSTTLLLALGLATVAGIASRRRVQS